MVLSPWLIVFLKPLWDERRVGNRAALGFDSDGSRDDKQTPQRINVKRSIFKTPERRGTTKLIFRDKRPCLLRGFMGVSMGGGGEEYCSAQKNHRYLLKTWLFHGASLEDKRLRFANK